jgi:hypothetical protein
LTRHSIGVWTMSSETSTDSEALQPWQLFTLAGLVGATIVVFVSQGHTPAGIILLSLTIFGAAAVGLATWRTFAPLSTTDDRHRVPIVGGRTRAALEREKALVLRSLKELEFDKAMGKVSDKDFAEMGTRLRSRAVRLMGQLDADVGYRAAIEQEIQRRVGAAPPASAVSTVVECRGCGARNEADARFCKRCGSSLETTE